jgi:hypothetical protein
MYQLLNCNPGFAENEPAPFPIGPVFIWLRHNRAQFWCQLLDANPNNRLCTVDQPRQDRSFLCKSGCETVTPSLRIPIPLEFTDTNPDSVTTWDMRTAQMTLPLFLNSRRLQSKCVSENLSAYIKYPILSIYQQEVARLHLLFSQSFYFLPDIPMRRGLPIDTAYRSTLQYTVPVHASSCRVTWPFSRISCWQTIASVLI